MNPVKIPLGATALLPLAVSTATAQETGASAKPNFVFIMTDQQRADLCGREGYPLDVTPFVDRMAGEGVWFDRAYTPAPISGPARVAFLTGRFPKATRVKSNHNIEDAVYKDDLFSFARRNGYRTALVGKNHAHLKPQDADCWRPYNHFAQQGRVDEKAKAFNRYLGTTDMYADYDPAPFSPEMQHPWRMVDDALAWIGNGDDKPFMMWLSFPEPHNPYQVSEPYYSMFPPEKLPPMRTDIRDLAVKGPEYELLHEMMSLGHAGYYEHLGRLRSNYHGMIRLIDDQIARFVEQLRKEGLYENTVFVVMSDHGDFAGEYGLMKKGVGLSDIVARVPFVWFGGPVPAQGLSHAHVSLVDVFPTFCEMAGGEIPEGVQGRSLANVIGGGDWAADRIVPDCARAWSEGREVEIRSPHATRPWQHVLEPLSGYLWLGAKLFAAHRDAVKAGKGDGCHEGFRLDGEAFNFGPSSDASHTVADVVQSLESQWSGFGSKMDLAGQAGMKECTLLKLCCDKALACLNWRATLDFDTTMRFTAKWYEVFYREQGADIYAFTQSQIQDYCRKAAALGLPWSSDGIRY